MAGPSAQRENAYAEAQGVRLIFEPDAEVGMPLYTTAFRVEMRLHDLLRAVIEAPTPTTREGSATLALAMAIDAEGNLNGCHSDSDAKYARVLVVLIGITLPVDFTGFGDEPDHEAREAALMSGPGRLPAWAQVDITTAA